ncbi:MAG: chemotaxis-specific protein-glutamate methyltransferase CheB [Alphaproteobacteria bacterium]|nr:chemotaxis-specific protein-glutamate methyltransferase CheB [Alphaproteobacteria bacterium]
MIVDDSAVVRGMVRRWLAEQSGIEVVAAAGDGRAAIKAVVAARPDVIILDIEMPVMDGLTALPELKRLAPDAHILISSTLSQRNAEISFRALNAGASDYLAKPGFSAGGNDGREIFRAELVAKVRALGGVVDPAESANAKADSGVGRPGLRKPSNAIPRVLTIGSSTGGPGALNQIFEHTGAAMAGVPVLVTQHMPPTFTKLLGDKLARLAALSGGEAVDGEVLVPGRLYLAPGGRHMRVAGTKTRPIIALDDGPPVNFCRPAVDPLFESVAATFGSATLAVVLTGMGADGAAGSVLIANAGGTVIAQDEATSTVWGMPGAAMAAGACAFVQPLGQIAGSISSLLTTGRCRP